MEQEDKKLEPIIPEGYKVIHDSKGWYIIPIEQEENKPISA